MLLSDWAAYKELLGALHVLRRFQMQSNPSVVRIACAIGRGLRFARFNDTAAPHLGEHVQRRY